MKRPPWPALFERIAPKLTGVSKPDGEGWVKFQCPCSENHRNGDQHASARANTRSGGVKCMSQNCPIGPNLNNLAAFLGVDCEEPELSRNGDDPVGRLARERLLSATTLRDKYGVASVRGGWAFPVDDADAKGNPHFKRDPMRWAEEHAPKNWWPKGRNVPAKDLVYGLSHIDQGVKVVYVAAGEIDAITLAEAGYPAVTFLAGEGTPPSAEAVRKLIAQGIEEVQFVYDVDAAGRDGAPNAGQACSREGLQLHVVLLPDDLGEGGDISDLWKRCKGDRHAFDDALLACSVTAVQPSESKRKQVDENPPATGNGEHLTDLGNARRLVAQHGADLRFCHAWSKWLAYDGRRWAVDDTAEIVRRGTDTVASIYAEAADAPDPTTRKALADHAKRSESEARITAMISLAESELGIPARPDELDRDPWLLNVHNGTLDLRSGKLRSHDQADLITRLAPVDFDPEAKCPTFEAFLARIMGDKPSLVSFIQRVIGYSLTGITWEEVMFILYGSGDNGKTTLLELLRDLLGDYAAGTPPETFVGRRDGTIPNDIARLKGKRFVATAEAEEGKRLSESLIKRLTGRDTISARFMRGEWFDFRPEFKPWLATNHKPIVRGQDKAIWDRLKLIPFTVTIPEAEQDKNLPDRLREELPGVLAWAVAGCLEWQRDGLGAPEEVTSATATYRVEQDTLAAFIEDDCTIGENAKATAKGLYTAYRAWCRSRGEEPVTQTAFGLDLGKRGLSAHRGGGQRWWHGIGLLAQPELEKS